MVGRGYLKPDLTKVRHDTPKGLIALLEKCIKFCRDERPEFEQVDNKCFHLLFYSYTLVI